MSRYDDVELDFAEERIEDYSRYFLLVNPFPHLLVPEEKPEIFVDRIEVMSTLGRVLRRVMETGESSTAVIVGGYGTGKSHILKYTKWRINETMSNGVALYVTPGRSIRDFYMNFMEQLGLEFFRSALATLPEAEREEVRQLTIFEDEPLPRALPEEAVVGMSPDFRQALQNLLVRRKARLSWDWLLGAQLIANERREIDVHTWLSKDSQVLDAFNSVARLARSLGVRVTCVLIDELEKVTDLGKPDRQRYYDSLRNLLDANPDGLCLIAGVSRQGWRDLREHGHPLRRRLIRNVSELEPFSAEDAKELIRRYLMRARQRYAEALELPPEQVQQEIASQRPGLDPELFPFTVDGIDRINGLARGIVSEILRMAGVLVDAGYQQGAIWRAEDVDRFQDEGVVPQAGS